MLGRNPFTDPEDLVVEERIATTPVIKLLGVEDGMAVFDIAMLDAKGMPVVTLHRFELRPGDSFAIVNLSVNLVVNHEEDSHER